MKLTKMVSLSKNILLSYVDLSSKLIEIKGKLDSCEKPEHGKYRAEISFQSPQRENFVSELSPKKRLNHARL